MRQGLTLLLATLIFTSMISGCVSNYQEVEKDSSTDQIIGDLIIFNDNGGWNWIEDERAIIYDGKILVGSVAGFDADENRIGDVELAVFDLELGQITIIEFHDQLEYDDHNSPALIELPDGTLVATYSSHMKTHPLSNTIFWRISVDGFNWSDERAFIPSNNSNVSYSSLHFMEGDDNQNVTLYNFFRGYNDTWNPSIMISNDSAQSWEILGLLIENLGHRPYVKYASNGIDEIHFVYTEGHPNNFDNSLYHAFLKNDTIFKSDGSLIKQLIDGPISISDGSLIFEGDSNRVAWCADIEVNIDGFPVIAYSVQINQSRHDLRYRYAFWDGEIWQDNEIAYAGSSLYSGEDDYSGNLAIDPNNPSVIYISTNVNPVTGKDLPNSTYEIFQGKTDDHGVNWDWTPITENSTMDNIRPFVPNWDRKNTAVIWLQGNYDKYTDYCLEPCR